jgi:hypothetical protein
MHDKRGSFVATMDEPGILHRPIGRVGLALSILLVASMLGGMWWYVYTIKGALAASLFLLVPAVAITITALHLWTHRLWKEVDASRAEFEASLSLKERAEWDEMVRRESVKPPAPMDNTDKTIIALALIVAAMNTADMVQGDLDEWVGVAIAVVMIAGIFVPRLKRQRPRTAAVVEYAALALAITALAGFVVQVYLGT